MKLGNLKVTALLIESGADVNPKSDVGKTPLYVTMTDRARWFKLGTGNISKLLMDNCADVTAKDEKLETPLHFADLQGLCHGFSLPY